MKEKKYLVLYYISFVITLIFIGYSTSKTLNLYSIDEVSSSFREIMSSMFGNALVIINLVLVAIFTIFVWKKKIKIDSIALPVMYIAFFAIVVVLCFLFNIKVIVPFIHFDYYLSFINIGYLLLNVYSLFLVNYKK